MSRKIAPRMAGLLASRMMDVRAAAEIRALIAVAKQAKQAVDTMNSVAREARNAHPAELDGDRVGHFLENASEALDGKLARLDKASAQPACGGRGTK